ncbi:sensor domain-containing protein [Demequina sp. NBRC 110053]|uniref:sensor histidine kinase n=1 Tax=Demequina sp. NBRC 110053 TaxID=1570342 RepID=UPI000A0441A6|nr:sensor domain-containing protein [Demequina sp. NBRC 110053]
MEAARRYFAVTWSSRTWREIGYLLLGLPVSIVWFTYVVTMYAVGISLLIIWVGVVVLAFAQWSLRPVGELERATANRFLDAGIEAPPGRSYRIHEKGQTPTVAEWGRWGHALLHDGQSWRILAWLMGRIVLGPVGFVLALLAVVVPISLIGAWLTALGHVTGILHGPGADEPTAQKIVDLVSFWVLVGAPVILAAIPMFAWVSHHYTSLQTAFARWALGPCDEDRVAHATERAELAETQVRIDQELHDSIGHMITMNIVQAGAGAHVFDSDPEFARQALRNIEERGRVAMGELDRIIATIRGDDAEPRAPLPTLDDLPLLLSQARAAGLTIDERLAAEPPPVALSRAGYAIIREGLTNAAKHAPGSTIAVHTATLEDALGLSVVNGPASAGAEPIAALRHARPGIRHGIAGIRDRAALLGGASVIGPTDDGGYEVLVLIPLELQLSPAGSDPTLSDCPWDRVRAKVSA